VFFNFFEFLFSVRMKSVVHSSSFIPGSQSVHHFFARNCLYHSIFNFSISSLGFFGPESVYSLLVFSIEAFHQMLRQHLSLVWRKSHRRAHYFLISADCFFHGFSLARVAPHINFKQVVLTGPPGRMRVRRASCRLGPGVRRRLRRRLLQLPVLRAMVIGRRAATG